MIQRVSIQLTTRRIAAQRKVMATDRAISTAVGMLIVVIFAISASSLPASAQTGGYSNVDGGVHAASIDAQSSGSKDYRLAYALYGEGTFDGEIWATTLEGVKSNIVDGTDWSSAAFSPNGKWLAFEEYNSAYVLNIDSGAKRHIGDARDFIFHWSPDSKFLTYTTFRADNQPTSTAWIEEADGQNKRRLSDNPEDILPFRSVSPFSPDGQFIMYRVNREYRRLKTGSPPILIRGYVEEYVVEDLSSGRKVRFRSQFFGNSARFGPMVGFTPDSRIYYPVVSPPYPGRTEFATDE